jgi:hypothetical protein
MMAKACTSFAPWRYDCRPFDPFPAIWLQWQQLSSNFEEET